MLQLVLRYYELGAKALENGMSIRTVTALPARDRIARMKYVPEQDFAAVGDSIENDLADQLRGQRNQKGVAHA
jgi:V/A-type H+-transporting ATPase subunit A